MNESVELGGDLVEFKESRIREIILGVFDFDFGGRPVSEDHVEGLVISGESAFESVEIGTVSYVGLFDLY